MKRLARSSSDRRFLGVCGGLGEYFNVDSTLIRLIFIISIVTAGVGIVPYFLMALIIPYDYQVNGVSKRPQATLYKKEDGRAFYRQDVTPEDDDQWSDF